MDLLHTPQRQRGIPRGDHQVSINICLDDLRAPLESRHVLNAWNRRCSLSGMVVRLRSAFLFGGFTLTELVLAICVLAILVILLFPALSMVRSASRQAVCIGNVRTMLQATLSYTHDNNGRFPTVDEDGGGSLSVLLHPTYLQRKVIFCPIRPRGFVKTGVGEPYSYAFNIGLARTFSHFALVPAPNNRVVLISELSNDTSFYTVGHLNNTMNRGRDLGTEDMTYDAQYHGSKERRGLNMGFLDGHAELVRPENNDFSHKSSSGYGDETNGGYFYAESQFKNMKEGKWPSIR
jgi:prepilin-type processing-associated H-X9-DG protein